MPAKDLGTARIEVLNQCLEVFYQELRNANVFKEGIVELIVKERAKDVDRLEALLKKTGNKEISSSLQEQLTNFYLGLDAGTKLAQSLSAYDKAEPALNKIVAEDEAGLDQLKENFYEAYQQTLSEHIQLAQELLRDKNSESKNHYIKSTTDRVNNLRAYVTDPANPLKLAAVVEDTNQIEKMKDKRHKKMVLGGIARLVGWGLMILSVVAGIGSAASLFVIGPAGVAGLAFSMGLTIAGKSLDLMGERMMRESKTENKVLATHDSLRLFTHPTKTNEKTPFLPKGFVSSSATSSPSASPTESPTASPNPSFAPPKQASTVTPEIFQNPIPVLGPPLIPQGSPAPKTSSGGSAPKGAAAAPATLFDEARIKKEEPLSKGWKFSEMKEVDEQKVLEVTHGDNKKFTIGQQDLKTNDADVETFKIMLACVKTNDTDLPSITTSNEVLKTKWLKAFQEVYPTKTAQELAEKVNVVEAAPRAEPVRFRL